MPSTRSRSGQQSKGKWGKYKPYATATGRTGLNKNMKPGTYQLRLRATPAGGKAGAWIEGTPFTLRLGQESDATIDYTGPWDKISAKDASGGAVRRSLKPGSTFTVTSAGDSIGLVMTSGKGQGIIEACLDAGARHARWLPHHRPWSGQADTSQRGDHLPGPRRWRAHRHGHGPGRPRRARRHRRPVHARRALRALAGRRTTPEPAWRGRARPDRSSARMTCRRPGSGACYRRKGGTSPMGLLEGRKALIFGVANDHSIAWGIAQALHAEGATVGFSSAEMLIEKRVMPLATSIGADFVEPCDVQEDADIARVFDAWKERYGTLDILIHAVAFAKREELDGRFVDTSREGFALALDISAYSLVAMARAAEPLMSDGGSILTLTYYGAEKVVANYNVMGVAKAALEACVRYLAVDLGPSGIRVNAISAGPVRTLAASGVKDFKTLHRQFRDISPMRTAITIEDVGPRRST